MQVLSRQLSGVGRNGRALVQQDALLVATGQQIAWLQQPSLALSHDISKTEPLLLAVADGVSSSPAAATASRLLLQLLAKNWQAGLLAGATLSSKQLRASQQQLTGKLAGKAESFGASTTIAALEVSAGGFKAINAGDSRIWRYRQGELTQLSVDHCFAAELTHTAEQPLASCYQALTSYIAADADAEDFVVSVTDGVILPGDQFLLTTDGIHDVLTPAVLESCLAVGIEHSDMLDTLLSETGFDDNASLIWFSYKP